MKTRRRSRKIDHTYQNFQYNMPKTMKFSRILDSDDKQSKYTSRKNQIKSVVHWGQRKLFMSEIEFLTKYSIPGDIVLYVGSAPGIHTYFLSLFFPFLNFILFDPSEFYCI